VRHSARREDVLVLVEVAEEGRGGLHGGVTVREQQLRGRPAVGDADARHAPVGPGLAQDPIDEVGAVDDLVR